MVGPDWALEALAARLDALAAEVTALVHRAERLAGRDTWIGPAADDALAVLGRASLRTGEAAVALGRAAAAVRERIATAGAGR